MTARNFPPEYDPRFYTSRSGENYYKHTLDEYLTMNGATVIGEETIEIHRGKAIIKEPCYVLARKGISGAEKFWISRKAFRMMKYASITDGHQYHITIAYAEFPGDIWYPSSIKWDSSDYSSDGSKHPVNVGSIVLSNVEINSDLSEFFILDIPPDVQIGDFDTGETYPAAEVPQKPTATE